MRKLICLSALTMLAVTGLAQLPENEEKDEPADKRELGTTRERIYVGGDLNVYFSSWGSLFNISPMGGYKLTKGGLMAGAGLTYQYTSSYDITQQRYTNHMVGWRLFLRQDLFRMVFVNAELETYYTRVYDWFTNKEINRAIPCGNVGLGFKRSFSDNSYYQVLIQYDLIQDRFTPYYVYPLAPLSLKLGFVFCLGDW